MSAEVLAWAFAALSVLLALLLTLAVGGNHNLAEENRRLRRDHLTPTHPATRRT